MPVIAFASPKGGVGKSTAALILATELAHRGAKVALLDGDPNQVMVEWGRLEGRPENVRVVGDISEDDMIDVIEAHAAAFPFVVIDLEGSKNIKMSRSVGRSDLIVIPLQGSQLDANRALDAVAMIKSEEKAYRRPIPHFLLFTRTSPAIVTRDERYVREAMTENRVPCLATPLHERAAYRALFAFGGGLRDLPAGEVRNLAAAIENAEAFASEILEVLAAAETDAAGGAAGGAG